MLWLERRLVSDAFEPGRQLGATGQLPQQHEATRMKANELICVLNNQGNLEWGEVTVDWLY
jgi:hypothetical protein